MHMCVKIAWLTILLVIYQISFWFFARHNVHRHYRNFAMLSTIVIVCDNIAFAAEMFASLYAMGLNYDRSYVNTKIGAAVGTVVTNVIACSISGLRLPYLIVVSVVSSLSMFASLGTLAILLPATDRTVNFPASFATVGNTIWCAAIAFVILRSIIKLQYKLYVKQP